MFEAIAMSVEPYDFHRGETGPRSSRTRMQPVLIKTPILAASLGAMYSNTIYTILLFNIAMENHHF